MMEENKDFVNFFNRLQQQEKKFFKIQVARACDVSALTVINWLKGDSYIKNPYREMINRVAGKKLFQTVKLACLSNV